MATTLMQYPCYRLPFIQPVTETEYLEFFAFTKSEIQQILLYLRPGQRSGRADWRTRRGLTMSNVSERFHYKPATGFSFTILNWKSNSRKLDNR